MKRGFLYVLALVALFSCEKNDPADIAALLSKLDDKVETAREVEIIYSDSARLRVTVHSPVMLNYLDNARPRQEFPEGLKVDFYDENGVISSHLTAKYGIRFERKGEMVVRDSVVWYSEKDEKLETEELIWDEKKQEVYTQKFVSIQRDDQIIYGHGFTANQDFSNATIKSVDGRINLKKPEGEPATTRPPKPALRPSLKQPQ